jgi:hypothetical protein
MSHQPDTPSGQLPSWKPRLKDSREIADYIQSIASSYVDHEMIVEYFRGASAELKWVPIAELRPGHPDANIPSARKLKRYLKMDPATMPPLVVEEGEIMDGNHRYRVAQKRGLSELLCYVTID